MKEQKYTYWNVVQGNYGYGWEDLEFVNRPDTTGYARYLRKEYKLAYPSASYRIIQRRELKQQEVRSC